jgi:hypothetical protein
MARVDRLTDWTRRNWFLPVLALLLAIEWAFAQATDWSGDGVAEAAILFDLCLFVPALHYLCCRRGLATKPLLMRTAALAFLGVYIASHLIPPEAQRLVAALGWARLPGLAVLAAIELWLLVAMVKLVFGGGATTEEVSAASGAPRWIARLMLAEARFWKWLWRLIRGGRGRK